MVIPEQNWLSPPAGLTLPGDEIHIWRAFLDQPMAPVEPLSRTLADDERRRASLFHFEQDRRRFMIGRGVLRVILGLYLNREPGELLFAYGPRGKPHLAPEFGSADLAFNLAHAGPLALYAFTRQRAIGVDVEHVRPLPDAEQIAARFFSARENAAYRELPADQRELGFYLCWTRKEAYVKALGDGLARPLEQFEVTLAPGEPARLLRVAWDPNEPSRWSLVSLTPAHGFVAALATEGQDRRVVCLDYAASDQELATTSG